MSDHKKNIVTMGIVSHIDDSCMLQAINRPGPPVIIISHTSEPREVIEINGERWELIPDKHSNLRGSSKMTGIIAASLALSPLTLPGYYNGGERQPTYPLHYLIKEYALIQQKKSHLSRRERSWVERQFQSKFRKL